MTALQGRPVMSAEMGQHQLAAIVFTDVVGFSRLAEDDETRALRLVHRDLKLISETCESFGGQTLKNTGDGLLMCFSSAEAAVSCALKVQQVFVDAPKGLPPAEVLQHRIGIHLGDVYLSAADVLGNDVNIAARLLGQAEPNGICISQTVYDVVKHKTGLQATYLGPVELKNIRNAIPVYKLLLLAEAGGAHVDADALPADGPPVTFASAVTGHPPAAAIAYAGPDVTPRPVGVTRVVLYSAAVAACVGALVVAAALLLHRPPSLPNGTPTPGQPANPAAPPIPPGPAAARGEVVAGAGVATELLPFVDVGVAAAKGAWKLDQGRLSIAADEKSNSLPIPIMPTGDYELDVAFTRTSGDSDVVIYLPAPSSDASQPPRQATMHFGYTKTFDLLTASSYAQTAIVNGQRHLARCVVKSAGANVEIAVTLDGKPVLTAKLRRDELAPFAPSWATPRKDLLGLGADDVAVEFHSCRLRMLTGQALKARP